MSQDTTRFWIKVDKSQSCWLWTAMKSRSGYGYIRWGGSMRRAHRVAYELLVGPIPPDKELDHLCRNRACVNPAHLEPVDHRTNTLRGDAPSAISARQTHCIRGHDLSWNGFQRYCPICVRVTKRAYKARKREEASAARG